MDCYNCKYVGTVPGSVHSSCKVFHKEDVLTESEASGQSELRNNIKKLLNI